MRSGTKAALGAVAFAALLGSVAWAQEARPAEQPASEPAPRPAPEPACAPPTFSPQLMTPITERTARDVGLVVGLFPGGSATDLPPVQLVRRRRSMQLRREVIAPGLYRLTPESSRIYGRWNLEGVAGEPEILFARSPISPPPTRPSLERVERYLVASGSTPRTEVRAHFGFPVPDGVVAIVSYFGDDDAPDLFARGMPRRDEAILYSAAGRCPSLPPGASPPPETGTVRVAFVDRFGQLSQRSDPRPL